MKLFVFASLLAAAAAFAPAQTGKASTAIKMSYESELGVIAPTGFFDPLGLSSNIDQETFEKYRAAELKHGRVAQLAVVGYVAAEIWRWPGDIAYGLPFADVPNGIAAFGTIPLWGWIQMIFAVGAVESYGWLGDFDAGKPDLPPAEIEKRKLNELQHGRLAMLATMELFRHDAQSLVSPGFDGLDNLITGLPFLYE
jgi:hypothetical protein